MTTIRAYTTIEQSRKLAEILPLESADMYYPYDMGIYPYVKDGLERTTAVYCWSLAALFGILPVGTRLLKSTNISSIGDVKYHCDCPKLNIDKWFDNSVDACVAMIEKLHEQNLL